MAADPARTGQATASDSAELVQAWGVQRRVLGALLLRELLTRYGRNNIGFLWMILEPMLFTLAITALWSATRSLHGSSIPIVAFALTGYSSILMWRNMPGRCIGARESIMPLLYHRQVKMLDVYLARVLLEFAAASASFVLLALAFWSMDLLLPPEDVVKVLAGWLLLAWFGVGLAFTIGGLSERFDIVGKLWSPLSYILFPLSGAAFLVDALPKNAQEIVLYLPMLHAVELIRDGYFGSAMRAHYDLFYLIAVNMLLSLTGLSLVRQIGLDEGEA